MWKKKEKIKPIAMKTTFAQRMAIKAIMQEKGMACNLAHYNVAYLVHANNFGIVVDCELSFKEVSAEFYNIVNDFDATLFLNSIGIEGEYKVDEFGNILKED